MGIPYEKIVSEDLNLGYGSASVTMPGGGTQTGSKIGIHSLLGVYYNVKDFGALGDGTTDDTAAINTAILAVYTAGGGVLFFPVGTYMISSAISLQPYVTLRGATPYFSIIKIRPNITWTAAAMIDTGTSAATDIGIESLGVDGNKANLSTDDNGIGIFFGRVARGFVRNCAVKDTVRSGICLGSSAIAGPCQEIVIANNHVNGCGKSTSSADAMGIAVVHAERVTVTGNVCTNNQVGIHCETHDGASDTCRDIAIVGNTIEGNGALFSFFGIGVVGRTSAAATQRVTVVGNTITGDGVNAKTGILCEDADSFVIAHNIVRTCLRHGLSLSGCTRGVVQGNHFSVLSQDTTDTYDGINADATCDEVEFIGNVITGAAAVKLPRYGINYAGTKGRALGNRIEDFVTGAVTGSGLRRLGNEGDGLDYVSGVSTNGIDTASTGIKTETVTHGLTTTPDDIQITLRQPSDEAVRVGGVWVDTIGATTFIVNVAVTTAGAGASTMGFFWRARVRTG